MNAVHIYNAPMIFCVVYVLGIFAHACGYMCVRSWVCVCECVGTQGSLWVSSSIALHLVFRQSLSLNLSSSLLLC